MALTLGQGAQMTADPNYRARIRVAMVRYAVTVMGETQDTMTSTVFAKRKQLAVRILNGPDALLDPFVSMVASDRGLSLTWWNPVNIASSTNANPSVVTTAAPHGLAVGDVVGVAGHLVNTNVNGVWALSTVGSATTFTVPNAGNGAGAATGTAMKMESDTTLNFVVANYYNAIAGTYTGEA